MLGTADSPYVKYNDVFFSSGVKRPKSEVNQSPSSSTEDKNEWSYISSSPIRLHDVVRS
jgi:hypothetical protein